LTPHDYRRATSFFTDFVLKVVHGCLRQRRQADDTVKPTPRPAHQIFTAYYPADITRCIL